jgi:class 3 adenylate cyclase
MFRDLVGSTALSAGLDPDDLRSVIGAYHKCVAETVAGFDGFVPKYTCDGVVMYSGIPALTRMMLSEPCGRDRCSWKPRALLRFGSISRPGIVFWE